MDREVVDKWFENKCVVDRENIDWWVENIITVDRDSKIWLNSTFMLKSRIILVYMVKNQIY